MIASPVDLLAELRARGLAPDATADAPMPAATHDRPWYIGLLLGVAGWFAGIFLLIFVFMLFQPSKGANALFVGCVLLAAAWGLFKIDRDGAFVSQLALALSVAGQFAVVFGLGDSFFKAKGEFARIALTAFVLQVALVFAMPNRLHRTLSTLFACVAWALFVRYGLWDQPSWSLFGSEAAAPRPTLARALVGWVVVWLPAGALLYAAIRREPAWMAADRQELVRPVTVGLIVGLAVATLLSHPFESFSWHASHDAVPGWLAIWPLLSAAASVAALAAAFALGSRGLAAVCIVAALAHLSHFYYAMGTTLLVKSATMLALGALLLWIAHSLKARAP